MSDTITVVFTPLAKKNPYQKYLALELKKHGASVVNIQRNREEVIGTLLDRVKRKETDIPDILHLHWTYPFIKPNAGIKALILGFRFLQKIAALKSSGMRVVWTIHNLKSHDNRHSTLEMFFLRNLAKQADALLVHCRSSRKIVSEAYRLSPDSEKKIFVVPHANYIGCYPNSISRVQARRTLGFDVDDRILLFLGQIRAYKGLGRLIKDFRNLRNPSIKLMIAGKPKSNQIFMNLTGMLKDDKRINLHPEYIPEEDIQTYMNASDAVVLPFTGVLTSGSALLAMSFGKPIIAPRIGCIPELLDHQPAFLYDPEDDEGLIKSLNSFSEFDDEGLQKIGTDNYRQVEHLTWNEMAKQTYRVYKHVTHSSKLPS